MSSSHEVEPRTGRVFREWCRQQLERLTAEYPSQVVPPAEVRSLWSKAYSLAAQSGVPKDVLDELFPYSPFAFSILATADSPKESPRAVLTAKLSAVIGLLEYGSSPITLQGEQVFVQGVPVPLDLTGEARADALCFLRHLSAQTGDWFSSSDIAKAEQARGGPDLKGKRWDRLVNRLPGSIREHIESNRRKGYRVH